MKKTLALLMAFAVIGSSFAQDSKAPKKIDLSGQAGDHFMLQIGSDRWLNMPDSISNHTKGFSRSAGVYVMINKPFKSNPKLSAAFGIGVGTSHIFFEKTSIDINGTTPVLHFNALDTLSRFKKYKVSTAYAEIPVELRYTAHPDKPNKSFKAAIGVKVGTILNAHTKGKNFQNAAGTSTIGYTQKISSTSYFNNTRLAATARVGYGPVSLFGTYNFAAVFKDNVAAKMNLLQIGISISGL